MHGPEPLGWLMAGLCALVGGYCLFAMGRGAPRRRPVAGLQALMGLGMAAMAVPAGDAAPPPAVFAVLFTAAALWAAALRRAGARHRAHHGLEAAAMVYMSLAMPAAGGHQHGTGAGGVPLLTVLLLAYFAGYALAGARHLLPAPAAGGPPPARDSPEVGAACRLALALVMFTMLLTL
ncbi:DUF5134 domain-containing protein [Streptomyces aidingensis]|uniref:DUF5134 domain-containing protein n=1 Tax=Streptomyces aidingensis TaxID=910347 RepID=A0A1I1PBY6_9ACTN|nr:DUF5134 domain-containing protein [Streptomyces aidingensis]SFD07414.1 protein of unknown function [Streptomyces aidingensis]